MISFIVPGRIGGKGAVRHSGKKHWNSVRTSSDMSLTAHLARKAMRGRKPLEGALSVDIAVLRHTPKSMSKRKAAEARYVTVKPDSSNIAKLLEDAMNKIVYRDDAQIAKLTVSKEYANYMPEQVQITITELAHSDQGRKAAA